MNIRIDELPASDWLQGLQVGHQTIVLDGVEVYGVRMNVILTSTDQGKALIVASNSVAVHRILRSYRKQWKIECLFRALKSKGFRLENSHMTLHDHVECLLCLLTIAYVWCVLVGLLQEANFKSHGRRAWSVVTLGLRKLIRVLTRLGEQIAEGGLSLIELLMPSQTVP